MKKNILLGTFSIFLAFGLIEFISSFSAPPHSNGTCINCWSFEKESVEWIGRRNKSSASHIGIKTCPNKSLCYKVKYSYDEYGRRIVSNQKSSKNHLILFGGSFVLGEGLEESHSLPYQLQEKVTQKIYNYGVASAGVPHALAFLKSGKLEKQVMEKSGIAIYFLRPFHIYRGVVHSAREWSFKSPYYQLNKDGSITRNGTVESAFPIKVSLLKYYNKLKNHSDLLKKLDFNYSSDSDEIFTSRMIRLLQIAKKEYENRFKGKFYVFPYPRSPQGMNPKLIRQLEEAGLELLIAKNYNISNKDSNVCPCDNHPSQKLNAYISNELSRLLIQ